MATSRKKAAKKVASKLSAKAIAERNAKRRERYAQSKKPTTKTRGRKRVNIEEVVVKAKDIPDASALDEEKLWDQKGPETPFDRSYLNRAIATALFRGTHRVNKYQRADVAAAKVYEVLELSEHPEIDIHDTHHAMLFARISTAISKYTAGGHDISDAVVLVDAVLDLHAFLLEIQSQDESPNQEDKYEGPSFS
jgi:hypothetical protein